MRFARSRSALRRRASSLAAALAAAAAASAAAASRRARSTMACWWTWLSVSRCSCAVSNACSNPSDPGFKASTPPMTPCSAWTATGIMSPKRSSSSVKFTDRPRTRSLWGAASRSNAVSVRWCSVTGGAFASRIGAGFLSWVPAMAGITAAGDDAGVSAPAAITDAAAAMAVLACWSIPATVSSLSATASSLRRRRSSSSHRGSRLRVIGAKPRRLASGMSASSMTTSQQSITYSSAQRVRGPSAMPSSAS